MANFTDYTVKPKPPEEESKQETEDSQRGDAEARSDAESSDSGDKLTLEEAMKNVPDDLPDVRPDDTLYYYLDLELKPIVIGVHVALQDNPMFVWMVPQSKIFIDCYVGGRSIVTDGGQTIMGYRAFLEEVIDSVNTTPKGIEELNGG